MVKKYFYSIVFLFTFFSFEAVAQEGKSTVAINKTQDPTIEGLSIYPNPTSSGKIFITSKNALDKKVEVFDVLGKKVLETFTTSKEVNVSTLSTGVYIIKIKEGEASATRKLIIN